MYLLQQLCHTMRRLSREPVAKFSEQNGTILPSYATRWQSGKLNCFKVRPNADGPLRQGHLGKLEPLHLC